jgi:hypothetical protein
VQEEILKESNSLATYWGITIVVFKTEKACEMVLQFYKKYQYWRLAKHYISKLIAWNISFLKDDEKFMIGGNKPIVKRCPEPADIIWENIYVKSQRRWLISVLVFFICIVAMIPTFFLLSYLYKLKRDYSDSQRGKDNGQTATYVFQILLTLGVFAVNFILDFFIRFLASYERQMTNSDYELSIIANLSILKFLNACLIPLLSNSVDDDWFEPQGLVEEIIFIVIFMVIGELFRLLVHWGFLIKWIIRNYERRKGEDSEITQKRANELYENDPIEMASTFTMIFVLFFTVTFFSPIIPGLSLLGLIGSIGVYWILKFTILRRKIIKYALNGKFITRVSEGIKVGILLNAILAYVFFDKIFGRDSTANMIQLIIAAIFFVVPVRLILERIFVKEVEADEEPIDNYKDELTHYDCKNPITKAMGMSRLQGNSLKATLTKWIIKKLENQVAIVGKIEIDRIETNSLGLPNFEALFQEQMERRNKEIVELLFTPGLRRDRYTNNESENARSSSSEVEDNGSQGSSNHSLTDKPNSEGVSQEDSQ